MVNYTILDHTADIGFEVAGITKEELFGNAVVALFDLILEREDGPSPGYREEEKSIVVKGGDIEDLLVNFLREVLYLFNGKKWVVINCRPVEVTDNRIDAQLFGEPYDPRKHHIKTEIKAVTYHDLSVEKKSEDRWEARVIFDV
jgi:SHS2 domain-containing protein